MRTSRVSRETSKVISATTALESVRRTTRSSLSRFATPKTEDYSKRNESIGSADIEDVVSGPRKRKRALSEMTSKKSSPRTAVKIEIEIEESTTFSPSPSKNHRVRKPARQVKNEETGEVEIHPPNDWEEIYSLVKEMRTKGAARGAAVDTMGCESLALKEVNPRDKRYQTLTALMLSSQTKDTTNAVAMSRLQTLLPAHTPGAAPGLNIENILAVSPEKLNELIWAVGFHNNKTKYIKAAAIILRDRYGSDIPDTADGLMSLPGVGPKMAYLCLSAAWGRTEGIGVDVHVHRITNLWGWHGAGTKGPEETRIALQKWLPRELWHEINWLLVGFGQTVCLPVGRRCGDCEVGLKGLCKSAERGKVIAGRRARESAVKRDKGGEELERVELVKEEVAIEDKVVNAPVDAGVDRESQEEPP